MIFSATLPNNDLAFKEEEIVLAVKVTAFKVAGARLQPRVTCVGRGDLL